METGEDFDCILTQLTRTPYAITKNDLFKFVDDEDIEPLCSLLSNDHRFLLLKMEDGTFFIPCELIFRKFISLNLYLSKIGFFHLNQQILSKHLSLVLKISVSNQVPSSILDFARSYNLVNYSWNSNEIIFPLAALLCQSLNQKHTININSVLTEITEDGYSKLKHHNSDAYIKEVLSRTDRRTSYIVVHRKGFFGEKQQTLNQLGKQLKITRERVRQIEHKFLRSDLHKRNVLKMVLLDFLMKDFNLLIEVNNQASIYIIYSLNFLGVNFLEDNLNNVLEDFSKRHDLTKDY